MANRAKSPEDKMTARVPVQVTPKFKAELEEMAQDTGVPISETARLCLERELEQWRKGKASQGS